MNVTVNKFLKLWLACEIYASINSKVILRPPTYNQDPGIVPTEIYTSVFSLYSYNASPLPKN